MSPTLGWSTSRIQNRNDRDQFDWTQGQMLNSAEAGWNQCLDKMAASLAKV